MSNCETIQTVELSLEEMCLWEKAEAAFGQSSTTSLSNLNSYTGSIACSRRLKNLGLLDWDEDRMVSRTCVAAVPRVSPLALGDSSYHFRSVFASDKKGERKVASSHNRLGGIKDSSPEKVQAIIDGLDPVERRMIAIALSTIDWASPNYVYRIAAIRAVRLCYKELKVPVRKENLVQLLNRLGFAYELTDTNFYVPAWFRELRP